MFITAECVTGCEETWHDFDTCGIEKNILDKIMGHHLLKCRNVKQENQVVFNIPRFLRKEWT